MVQEKSQLDDADLVARAMEELPYVTRSYQVLAGRYYPLLLRYCINMLREQAEAEDACQVILLKVFRGLPRFQGRSSFKTWLFKIAANTCYSQMQKLKRERERFARLDRETLDSTVETNPTNFQTLRKDKFENMIESLSEQEQHLLGLRFLGELSLDEIAEIMGMGLSATKMRFYRALKKLGPQLERDEIE
ncbi:MAG: sigma-70 family RNA polymerase sigma factor [Gammaproteobacteria bacterium]|nr:sigma-70 family RNA polymerase sigma factor [Gammaproteobacteria bacterium]